jgi:chemotaxis regulatin CheY-phosphate phosphatase CheZ
MSIAKKRTKKANNESLRKSLEKYVVAETAMRDFIESLSIKDIDAAAARLQAIVDVTSEVIKKPIDHIATSDLQLIKRLTNESRNKYYKQIIQAVVAALEQGPQGVRAVHQTAARCVELAFRWTLEYFAAFDLYRDKLREIRREAKSNKSVVNG